MASWPNIIDDDGSGTTGTVLNDALFDQIKLYVDDTTGDLESGFIDLKATAVWTTYEGAAIPVTQLINRYKLLTRIPSSNIALIVWQVAVNPWTLPASTGLVIVKQLPFSATDPNEYYAVARASSGGGGFLTFGGGGQYFLSRMDGQVWPAGTGYVFWTTLQTVSGL